MNAALGGRETELEGLLDLVTEFRTRPLIGDTRLTVAYTDLCCSDLDLKSHGNEDVEEDDDFSKLVHKVYSFLFIVTMNAKRKPALTVYHLVTDLDICRELN
jgi:hypothetical protein